MRNTPRVDRTNRRRRTEDADPLGPARSWALAIVALCLAFLATVAPTPIATAGSQQSTTQRPQSATRVATAKTPTIVALELSRVVEGVPQLPEDAVERVAAAAREASGLILLDIRGLPLRHALLPPATQRQIERDAYERGLSLQIAGAIKDARARAPGIAFGVLGLPFEQGLSVAESNASYEAALQAVDVMNPLGGVIAAGTNPTGLVRDRYRSSLSLAAGRPVVFRGGSGWQVATSPGGPSSHRETQQVVASDEGSVAVAPATAAGISTASVSTVVADWGTNASGADLNADGVVDGFDLAVALALNPNELLTPLGAGGGGSGAGGGGGGGGTPPDGGGSGPGGGSGEGEDPFADAPVLVAGSGFDGPTSPPMPVGTSDMPGYNAKVIARWNVVPYQRFDEPFAIGIVAFHINGIDRVDFSVNGGPWHSVEQMTRNPATGIDEYWVVLDPAGFPGGSGAAEVRAVAYPSGSGMPRLLAGPIDSEVALRSGEHSMMLYPPGYGGTGGVVYMSPEGSDANGDGSASAPVRTFDRAFKLLGGGGVAIDGSTIFLMPGSYSPADAPSSPRPITEAGWVTIRPAPGVARADVRLLTGRFRMKHVRLQSLTLDHSNAPSLAGISNFSSLGHYLWIDSCDALGGGRWTPSRPIAFSGWRAYYVTDSIASNYRDAFQNAALLRNVQAFQLGSDAFGDSWMVLDCVVDGIDSGSTDFHPDVYQFSGTAASRDNTIVFGLAAWNARAQGIFADDLAEVNNSAFVNVLIDRGGLAPGEPAFSQWKDVATNHLLLHHVTLADSCFVWRTASIQNVSVVGVVFGKMMVLDSAGGAGIALDAWFRHNHFVDTTTSSAVTRGTDISVGDPGLVVSPGISMRPGAGSSLVDRVPFGSSSVPRDLSGSSRLWPSAVGAYVGAP